MVRVRAFSEQRVRQSAVVQASLALRVGCIAMGLACFSALSAPSYARAVGHSRAAKSSLSPSAHKHQAPSGGVRAMFDRAQTLYEAGKYPQALAAYQAILRKYPGHEPSAIQLAKTLYRMDRIRDSYAVFARINPQSLDAETSYEYGWAFYMQKQWEGALYAFKRVPKGHALFDLANYYGAICAIKLRRYDDAEDMLDKAVVLPDKLAKSRSLYVKHVQALKLMQEKSSLAKDREAERERLKQKDKSLKKGKKAEVAAPPAGTTGYVHNGFMVVDKTARVQFATEQQLQDFSGTKEDNFNAKITTFELKSGPILPLPFKAAKDRQVAVGLQLLIAAEDRLTEGREQRVIVQENDRDIARTLTEDPTVTHTKSGTVGTGFWFEAPLPEGVWAALGGDLTFIYPDFERQDRTGTRRIFGDVDGRNGIYTYTTEIAYSEIVDPKTKPVIDKVAATITAKATLPSKFDLEADLNYTTFDYLVDQLTVDGSPTTPSVTISDLNLDGPDSSASISLIGTQGLPLGFSLSARGTYESQANNTFHNMPTYGQIAADAQILTGKATLAATPFPWLSAKLEQTFSKTKWRLAKEETRDTFELNVPDYLETTDFTIAVNMLF